MMTDQEWKARFYSEIDKTSRLYNTLSRKMYDINLDTCEEFWKDALELWQTRKDIGRISKEFVTKVFYFRTKWYFHIKDKS